METGALGAVMGLLIMILAEIRLFFTRPSWLSEVMSGLATFGWGALAMNAQPQSGEWPSVDLFLSVADSSIWGLIAITLGMGQVFAFRPIDEHWRKPWLRWGTAIMVAWIWGGITISAARIEPWAPGLAAYAGWWALNVYLIFRIFWARG